MKKIEKTNAARLLDRLDIPYTLHPYPVDEQNLDARTVALHLGEDIRRVFKTLVLRGDRAGLLAFLLPGDLELDLKTAARLSANKRVDMLPVKELLPATGYIRGGCSPLAMKRPLPTWIHHACQQFDTIFVSAGIRGLQIRLAPADLLRATRATIADLTPNTTET
ncbi:MAG: Cys-tRNA(Pro) deacylase [Odoribacteraceae bacterium]|jgi:Cys-tRNA(Pro)/Cys-tRNA(Cys) deacylase|nr:Cys-tRNA(Pro) deacylase [Odoribacteraceae bacterium]